MQRLDDVGHLAGVGRCHDTLWAEVRAEAGPVVFDDAVVVGGELLLDMKVLGFEV